MDIGFWILILLAIGCICLCITDKWIAKDFLGFILKFVFLLITLFPMLHVFDTLFSYIGFFFSFVLCFSMSLILHYKAWFIINDFLDKIFGKNPNEKSLLVTTNEQETYPNKTIKDKLRNFLIICGGVGGLTIFYMVGMLFIGLVLCIAYKLFIE